MRAFTSLAVATALFASTAFALPILEHFQPRDTTCAECLKQVDAAHLVNGYAMLLNSTFSSTRAADILTKDYLEYSDSINFLAGVPLGIPIFNSSAALSASQAQQTPAPLQVLSIDAISCTNIAWRWLAYPGSGMKEVKGINIIYAVQGTGSSNGWQIGTQFAEFNSAAWNLDIGGTCVPLSVPARLFKKEVE